MKPAARAIAFAAALALHAVLIAAIAAGLSQRLPVPVRAEPMEIALLQPAIPVRHAEKPRPANPPQPPHKQTTEEPPQPPKPETRQHPRPQHSKPKPKPEKHHPRGQAEKPPPPPPQQQAALPASPPPPAREPAPAAAPAAAGARAAPGHHVPTHTGASIPASYAASNAEPPYPRLSRLNEEQGTVMLRVLVKPDGTVAEVRIQSSSGYPLLDRSASTTVRGWRFNPATMDGKPVAEWCQVPVQFTLPGS